jgi:hypothetical protein
MFLFFILNLRKKNVTPEFFANFETKCNELFVFNSQSSFKGKAKHPGLVYFSAIEWYQFAEMHFRHHFWQKKKPDALQKGIMDLT